MTLEKRKRFEHVIRALQQKTVERGATEAEAMEAAAKARELMDRYEINELSDEEIVEEGAVKDCWNPANMQEMEIARMSGPAVADFTDTKVYFERERFQQKVKKLVIVGLRSDVDFALYLFRSLAAFGVRGAVSQSPRERTRYMRGYSMRVAERLRELQRQRKTAAGTGRALVVIDIKKKAIEREIAGLKLKVGSRVTFYRDGAYHAGQARGDQASFGRPVEGNQKRLA